MMLGIFLGLSLFLGGIPDTPEIREPTHDGQIVGASDVHMEAAPMTHPDPERKHASSDWEIVTEDERETAWHADAAEGLSKNHIHLGDGEFVNSHEGRTDLLFNTHYIVRVRYRDDLGAVSEYAERHFVTGNAFEVYGLQLDDVRASPAPTWTDEAGAALPTPAGASMHLDTGDGQRFLDWTSGGIEDAPALSEHAVLRLRLVAGGADWNLPQSRFFFHTDDDEMTLFLPALTIAAGQTQILWISSNGSTYWPESATNPTFGYFNLARSNPIPWRARDGYRVELFASDLQMVVNIAMVPNPGPADDDVFCYAVELHGEVKAILRDGAVTTFATGLLNYDANEPIPGSGEKGLTGIAVDPATGDVWVGGVYLAHSRLERATDTLGAGINADTPLQANSDNSTPPPGQQNPVFYNRLMRLRSTDGGRTASTVETVLDIHESTGAAHQFGAIYFLGDSLFVNVGDGTIPYTAHDLNSYLGKILRLRPDGQPDPTNPFYDPTNGISAMDYIYSYGYRNPFGGGVRPIDQAIFCVENGPGTDRLSKVERGWDYGWNGYDESMTINAIYNWAPSVAPVAIAFCDPNLFEETGFPESVKNSGFVTEFGPAWAPGTHDRGKRISEFLISPTGELISGPTPLVEYTGARLGRGTACAVAFGQGGLYFSDFFKDLDYQGPFDRGSHIFRVTYVGEHEHNDEPAHTLTVTCPDNYSIPPDDENGAVALYPDPIVDGAVGDVGIRYEPPAGSQLPLGETAVRVFAVDGEFATGECTFFVTVVPTKADDGTGDGDDSARPDPETPIDTGSPIDQESTKNPCGNGACPATAATMLLVLMMGLIRRSSFAGLRRR